MSRRARLLVLAGCGLVTVLPPGTADGIRMPAVEALRQSPNRTDAGRSSRAIERVVIHVTEGSYHGSIYWLGTHRAHASAHFVVSRDGRIAQLVDLRDVAWHAGNRSVNERSVGIEHEGWTYGRRGFTSAQYRASARLTAYLLERFHLPADRRHVIGHDEVPDPRRPWLNGGASHHTDPGPSWDWRRYMALVRRYIDLARPLRIAVRGVESGDVLHGRARWSVRASRNVGRVEFRVDGRVLWRDKVRPFAFAGGRGLPTLHLGNGRHVLEVIAFRGTRSVSRTLAVVVRNRAFRLTTAGARRWRRAEGLLRLRVRAWGARARSVALSIDGRRAALDRRPPFLFRWDTRLRRDGKHVLAVVAHASDGRRATTRIPVVVSNRPRSERVRVAVLGQSIGTGQTLTQFTVWRADVRGRVAHVEFLVDGVPVGADVARPFTIGLQPEAQPGRHQLTVRAVGRDGSTTASTVAVVFVG